jgi:hypothetical protein
MRRASICGLAETQKLERIHPDFCRPIRFPCPLAAAVRTPSRPRVFADLTKVASVTYLSRVRAERKAESA